MNQPTQFNSYLDKVRKYHRRAQTNSGFLEVCEELGSLTINVYLPEFAGPHALIRYDDALLKAIAEKVIPSHYLWELDACVGTAAQIVFLGVASEPEAY